MNDLISDMLVKLAAKFLTPENFRQGQDLSIAALRGMPETVKKNILRPVVGRVATNSIFPYGYNIAGRGKTSISPNIMDYVKGVIRDQPAYSIMSPYLSESNVNPEDITARRSLFRGYFDMEPQDTGNVFNKEGKMWSFNPATPQGFRLKEQLNPASLTSAHSVLGTFQGDVPPYQQAVPDKWDFNLHPDERAEFQKDKTKPYPLNTYGRQLFEEIGNPVSVNTSYP